MPKRSVEDAVMDRAVAKWTLELDLHPAQRMVWEDPARFKVVAAGRRFGKTLLAAAKCIQIAASHPDAVVMWVSPSHTQSRLGLRMVAKALPPRAREVNRTLSEIYLSTGGRIIFRSGERWDNLRGEGLDLVVVDEAAFVAEQVWTHALRPALADRNGQALLIGTFDGENWFYDLWRAALDPDNLEWQGFKFITADNPYIPAAEISEAKRNMPAEVFEQEFMSSPLAYSGAVFRGERLDAAWKAAADLAEVPTRVQIQTGSGAVLVTPTCEAGLDWGWNVTALEIAMPLSDGRLAWVDEHLYERVELGERCVSICRVVKQWNVASIFADAADPTANTTLAMHLEHAGLDCYVQPVPFNTFKKPGIQARNWYLETGRELIFPACRQLLIDSKAYHYDPRSIEEKPAKGHDHTVDASIALYAVRSYEIGESLREAS